MRIEEIRVCNELVHVFIDPSHEVLTRMFDKVERLRALIDEEGHLYVWNAHIAVHCYVSPKLGIDECETLMLSRGAVEAQYRLEKERLLGYPALVRAYGHRGFEVVNDAIHPLGRYHDPDPAQEADMMDAVAEFLPAGEDSFEGTPVPAPR